MVNEHAWDMDKHGTIRLDIEEIPGHRQATAARWAEHQLETSTKAATLNTYQRALPEHLWDPAVIKRLSGPEDPAHLAEVAQRLAAEEAANRAWQREWRRDRRKGRTEAHREARVAFDAYIRDTPQADWDDETLFTLAYRTGALTRRPVIRNLAHLVDVELDCFVNVAAEIEHEDDDDDEEITA